LGKPRSETPASANLQMPSAYKEATYREVTRWLAETEIVYVPHGKKAGSKSSVRYDAYAVAKTVGEAIRLGSKPEDLLNDFEKGLCKQTGGPKRENPLDLMAIEDASDLTEVDLILARWGYHEGREEHDGRYGELKDSKDAEDPGIQEPGLRLKFKGLTAEQLEEWRSKMNEQFKKLRKVVMAKKHGMKPADIKHLPVSTSEGADMVALRSKAEVEAGKILEAARVEGRKVRDEEVLRMLRIWYFRKNYDRPNVTPEDQEYVLSDTMGLLRSRDGRYMATLPTREYPQVIKLLCQSLKDSRPEGAEIDWPFTSISVNSSYAAKRHRDANNLGPSALKCFGEFTGGRLQYWPDDDRTLKVEDLLDSDKVTLDPIGKTAVFDGCRCHAVEPYEGEERFSLVFFTIDGYSKTPQDVRDLLVEVGINFPNEESEEYMKTFLPVPKGYQHAKVQSTGVQKTVKPRMLAHPRGSKPGTTAAASEGIVDEQKGKIGSFFKADSSTPVKRKQGATPSAEPESSVKQAKVSFTPLHVGMACTLTGFLPREGINGKEVVLKRYEPKHDKWIVSGEWLPGGTVKRIRSDNLVPVPADGQVALHHQRDVPCREETVVGTALKVLKGEGTTTLAQTGHDQTRYEKCADESTEDFATRLRGCLMERDEEVKQLRAQMAAAVAALQPQTTEMEVVADLS